MLTVRFPNGQAVTYNRANYLEGSGGEWMLYTREGGRWIASIQKSAGAMIETESPCTIENPVIELTAERAMEMVATMLEQQECPLNECAVRMKAALRNFDARSWIWS